MANLDAVSGSLKTLRTDLDDPANAGQLPPPPTPPPLDTVQTIQPIRPELAGVDSRQAPPASGGGAMFKAGAAALSQPLASASTPTAAATSFNGMSATEQRDMVADIIKSDPTGAARYAESLAADQSSAGKQAYADYWKAVDAATQQGGPLFNHPEKAAAFLHATNELAGPGADRVRIDALDHVYAGFLATPTYRGFARDELGNLAAGMIRQLAPKHANEPGLVRAFGALPAYLQRDTASGMSGDAAVAAARFADEVGAVSKDGLDNFVEGASRDSARFRDEWMLRDGTRDQRMDVLARHYPDRLVEQVERYKTSNPERYHQYMQLLAEHHPDRFVEEFAGLRTTAPQVAARFEADLLTGEGPVFDAIAGSRDPRLNELKQSAADHFVDNEEIAAAYRLFKADPNVAAYALGSRQPEIARQTESLMRRKPDLARELMSGTAEAFAKEVVRQETVGNEDRAKRLGIDLGSYIGIVHQSAMKVYRDNPARGRSAVENVVRGVIKVASHVHAGAKTANRAIGLIDAGEAFLDDLTDNRLSEREVESRFRDFMIESALLAHENATGAGKRSDKEMLFLGKISTGYDIAQDGLDPAGRKRGGR